jgi:hypothetical protein
VALLDLLVNIQLSTGAGRDEFYRLRIPHNDMGYWRRDNKNPVSGICRKAISGIHITTHNNVKAKTVEEHLSQAGQSAIPRPQSV